VDGVDYRGGCSQKNINYLDYERGDSFLAVGVEFYHQPEKIGCDDDRRRMTHHTRKRSSSTVFDSCFGVFGSHNERPARTRDAVQQACRLSTKQNGWTTS
jgi:hypothetical protein